MSKPRLNGIAATNALLTRMLGRKAPTSVSAITDALKHNAAAREALNRALDQRVDVNEAVAA